MALRSILAEFGFNFDTAALKKGEGHVNETVETLKKLGGVVAGAFAVKEVFEFTHALLEEADVLAKHSEALGVSAIQLQGWQHAAKLSGSSAEEFDAAFTKFTRNVAEAADGGKAQADAFKAVGVSIKDAAGHLGAPIELLDGVVAGLENIHDPAKRTQVVMDLFGKSGARLLPLFSEGTEGLKKLRAEVEELGFGFNETFLEDAQEVNDNVDRLKLGLKGLVIQGIGPLLPGLTDFTKNAVGVVKEIVQFVKHTNILKSGLILLATKGLVSAAVAGGTLGKTLLTLGRFALTTVAPLLILEDVLTFFTGGNSKTGDLLERFFGKGTSEKVRKFVADVKRSVHTLFTELTQEPKRFLESMEITFNGLRNGEFWKFIFGDGALASWAQFWTDLLIEPGNFPAKLKAALGRLLGGAPDSAPKVETEAERASPLDKIPGFTALRDRLGPGAQIDNDFRASQGLPAREGETSPQVRGETSSSFLDSIPFLKGLKDRAGPGVKVDEAFRASQAAVSPSAPTVSAPRAAPVSNSVVVNNQQRTEVTVAAGTPAETARAVGAAASRGASKGYDLKAARAALVPGAG